MTRRAIRLRLLEFVRAGNDLGQYYPVQLRFVDDWTGEVSEFLREYESALDMSLIESFLGVVKHAPYELLADRNAALERIAESLREDDSMSE